MSTTPVAPGGNLDKNAFLQLMVTQMKYQDPLQPQDNSQFMAQLAQFTALEQMTNVAQSEDKVLQTLQTMQAMNQVSFEHQLIGTNVTVTDSNKNTVTGKVDSITFVNGDPQLVVGGNTYPLSALASMG